MRISYSILALGLGLALATSVSAAGKSAYAPGQLKCGTHQPSGLDADLREVSFLQSLADRSKAGVSTFSPTVIPVYFHVIRDNAGNGGPTTTMINNQINVLNNAFGSQGFTFQLVQTTFTNNSAWYTVGYGSTAETQMKQTLRQGSAN